MAQEELAVRVRLIDARLAQVEAERTGKAISGIGRSTRSAGKEARTAKDGFRLFGGAMSGFKWAAATTGIGALAFGLRDVVKAGQEFQAQQAQMRQSLVNTHQPVAQSMKMLNEQIDRSTVRGGFSPQEQSQGLAQFIRLTSSATQAVTLNNAAMNLARGAHLDYSQAVRMLSQIQTGNTGRLQRYIGILRPVTSHVQALTAAQKKANPELLKQAQILDKQATAAEANRLVQQKYGGAQSAYSHTAAGALENTQHAFNLLAEQMGKVFLPILTQLFQWLATLAPKIGAAFSTAIKWIKSAGSYLKQHKTLTTALIALVGSLLVGYMAFRAVIGVIRAVEAAQIALNIVMAANPIGIVIVAVAALAAAFITLWTRCKAFRDGVKAVFAWLKTAAQNVAHAVAAAFQWIGNAARNTVRFIGTAWRTLFAVLTWPFRTAYRIVATVFGWLRGAVAGTTRFIDSAFKWLTDKLTWPFRQMLKAAKAAFGWIKGAAHDVGNFVSGLNPFHSGGMVKVRHFAAGGFNGPVGGVGSSDSVPAMLAPGEFVLRKQIVSSLGAQNLQRVNQGGQMPDAQGTLELHTHVMIGARQVAEAVTHYGLKKAARA